MNTQNDSEATDYYKVNNLISQVATAADDSINKGIPFTKEQMGKLMIDSAKWDFNGKVMDGIQAIVDGWNSFHS